MVWPAIIAGVAGLAGSALAAKSASDAQDEVNERQAAALDRETALQREFAQHGVRWRVEDAKAAGVHPLYALGGSGASYSPQAVTIGADNSKAQFLSEAGQHVGRAASAAMGVSELEMRKAQLEVLKAQASKDEALAMAARSEAARAAQGASWSSPIEMGPTMDELHGVSVSKVRDVSSGISAHSLGFDTVSGAGERGQNPKGHITPDTLMSSKPFWERYSMGPMQMLLPKTSEPQEVFEDKPSWFWLGVIQANVAEYGAGWLRSARRAFPTSSTLGRVIRDVMDSGTDVIFGN